VSTYLGRKALNIGLAAAMVALACVTAQLKFNVGPVPYTMQNVAVVMSGMLLPPTYAALAMAAYVALIAIGAPVAAGFTGGLAVVLGYCGGYLFGFIISAFLMSLLRRAYLSVRNIGLHEIGIKDFAALLGLSLVALLPTYILGYLVFMHYAVPGSLLYKWSSYVASWLGLRGVSSAFMLFVVSVLIFIPQDLFMDHVIAITASKGVAKLLLGKGVRIE